MKKSLKHNNKGFVLVETLIATVFVASIFSIVFLNIYPLVGEYENRENYDDVDSKYGAYWVKKVIEDRIGEEKYNYLESDDESVGKRYMYIDSACILHVIDTTSGEINGQTLNPRETDCAKLFSKLEIKNAYLTTYNIENFRTIVNDSTGNKFSSEFKDYINYLPSFGGTISEVGADYRVLVEFERSAESGVGKTYKYKTFANMEVKRDETD